MQTKFQAAFTRDYVDDTGQLTYGDVGLHLLDESSLIEYRFLQEYHQVVTPEQIADVDGLFVHYPHVTRQTFAQGAGRLTVVARCGAGYDRIDVQACTQADVALTNAPNALRFPSASSALMFILVLAKQLWMMDHVVREGRWDLRSEIQGIEPRGKTLGIVGLGNIGRELVRLVAPLDMRLLAYDPYVDPELARPLNVTLVSLETLLRESDFVSLHCLLTEETHGLIGGRELALMKPTAYLINMARGPVIDHEPLVQALSKRQIAGAGLDVFHLEPLPADDPLTQLDNVVLSPHWAAGTLDAFRDAGMANIKGMLQAAQGELPDHIVNREVIERPGFQAKLARFKNRSNLNAETLRSND
jgi:phosphoglycerate dehydrogenase-like enzyme